MSELPVKIPPPYKGTNKGEVRWLNELREAVRRLSRQATPRPVGGRGGVVRRLPLEAYVAGTTLKMTPGLVDLDEYSGVEKANPGNGDWYLVAKAVINASTGALSSTDLTWESSIPADTTTDWHVSIASVNVASGVIGTITQVYYGPLFVRVIGGFDDKWEVIFF